MSFWQPGVGDGWGLLSSEAEPAAWAWVGRKLKKGSQTHGKAWGRTDVTVHKSVAIPSHSTWDLGPMGLASVPLPRFWQ